MNIEANLPSRHILWWVYSPYPVAAFLWGSYLMVAGGNYSTITWLSIALDALGLFGLYCFLRQRPSFTRGFWVLFAIFYIVKLTFAFYLMISIFFPMAWAGGNSSRVVLLYCAGAIFSMPFLIAIIMYAFGSKQIWAVSRSKIANA